MNAMTWQQELATAITDPAELLHLLALPSSLLPAMHAATLQFGLRVPRSFVNLMQKKCISDPLLRQVLPVSEELLEVTGFIDDPVGEVLAAKIPGILTKYSHRALVIASAACAVHCRYCLRRKFPYTEHHPTSDNWQLIVDTFHQNTNIQEVILSGGDPLTLSDSRLSEIVTTLTKIPHLRRLRIHTRLPILIPQRITQQLLDLLQNTRLNSVIVVHVNHPHELTENTCLALRHLRNVVTILNQSVLLRGVNDKIEILTTLSERLFDMGVLPYYIHLLDRITGAAHFEVKLTVAKTLLATMRQQLPGYLVPRLVREEPGAMSKTLIM